MKRWLIATCCVMLMVSSLPLLMTSAEPETTTGMVDPTGTTGFTDPTDPTGPVDPTDPTDPTGSTESTEFTDPTDPTDPTAPTPSFVFTEYGRQLDMATGILSVEWNYVEGGGIDVIGVHLGDRAFGVTGSQGRFTVNLSGVGAGTYAMQYVLYYPETGDNVLLDVDPLEIGGEQTLSIRLEVEDTLLKATLTNAAGEPVANYPLQFTLNRVTTVNSVTDSDGVVTMTANAALTEVTCVAPRRVIGSVQYSGATAAWSSTPQTTQNQQQEGPVTTTTRWSATKPTTTTGKTQTFATIVGAGTTSVENGEIVLNVSVDEGVIDAFGLDEDDFHDYARLLMSGDLYASLVGNANASLMMTMGYSPFQITDQHISRLVSGQSKYSRYAHVERIAVAIGMQFIDKNGKTIDIPTAPQGTYTVRMPVPESMLDCPVLAVSAIQEDGLVGIIDVTVENGYLEFSTTGFTSVALLGFGEGASRSGGGVAWQLIVLLVIGILLLGGAVLLMYFFVWRKPEPTEEELIAASVIEQPEETAQPEETVSEKSDEDYTFQAPEFMIDQLEDNTKASADPTAQDMYSQAPEEDNSIDLYSSDDHRPRE